MARLWLHIGHGKTGTSAIQAALRHRSGVRGDLFYPGRGQTLAGAHHLLFPLDKKPWDKAVVAVLEGLAADMDDLAGGRPVVLSSEHLCYINPVNVATLAQIFTRHDVQIVYYVRRQDELIESVFRQKQIEEPGRFPDPDELFARTAKGFDFERLLAPWEAEFGPERLHLRLYHRQTCASDTVSDFEHLIGLKAEDSVAEQIDRTNMSLSPTMTRVLQLFDRHYPQAERRAAFVAGLRGLSEAEDSAPLVPASLRQLIMAQHANANARIAARYLTPAEAALFLAE